MKGYQVFGEDDSSFTLVGGLCLGILEFCSFKSSRRYEAHKSKADS